MNPLLTLSVLLVASLPYSQAIFDGGISLVGLSATGGAALTAGTSTVFFTQAGLAAGALGLLGAGIAKSAILGSAAGRGKRDTQAGSDPAQLAALQLVDSYFFTILQVDVDDCGKKLVCEIEALNDDQLTSEEKTIQTNFDGSATIDPLSYKAEYDIASYIGRVYESDAVCRQRYNKCPHDRKTILQALAKIEKQGF